MPNSKKAGGTAKTKRVSQDSDTRKAAPKRTGARASGGELAEVGGGEGASKSTTVGRGASTGGTAKSKARTPSASVPQNKGGSASSVSRKPNVAAAMKQAGTSSKSRKQAGTSSKSRKQAGTSSKSRKQAGRTSSSPAVASTSEEAASSRKSPIASSTWTSSLKVAPKRTGARRASPKSTRASTYPRAGETRASTSTDRGARDPRASTSTDRGARPKSTRAPTSTDRGARTAVSGGREASAESPASVAVRLFLDDSSSDEDASNAHEEMDALEGMLRSAGLSAAQIAEIKEDGSGGAGGLRGSASGSLQPEDHFDGEDFDVALTPDGVDGGWEDFDVALTPDGFDGGFDGDAASMLGMALTPAPGDELTEKNFDSMGLDPSDDFGETPAHPPEEDLAQDFSESFSGQDFYNSMDLDPSDDFGETPVHPPAEDQESSFSEQYNLVEFYEDPDPQQIVLYSGNEEDHLRKVLEVTPPAPLYPSTPAYVSEKAFPSAYVQTALAQYNEWTTKEDYLLSHAVKTQVQRNVMEQVWLCGGPPGDTMRNSLQTASKFRNICVNI